MTVIGSLSDHESDWRPYRMEQIDEGYSTKGPFEIAPSIMNPFGFILARTDGT